MIRIIDTRIEGISYLDRWLLNDCQYSDHITSYDGITRNEHKPLRLDARNSYLVFGTASKEVIYWELDIYLRLMEIR
jgi:hypothetical protein